jgi:DNA-binding NtrC family response regulator
MIGHPSPSLPGNESSRTPAGQVRSHKAPGIVQDGRFAAEGRPRAGKQPMSVIERGAFMSELAQTLSIPEGQTLKDLVQEYERQLLLMALELAGWNQRRVAASLGLLPSTLSEKMKRLGLRSTRPEMAMNPSVPALGPEAIPAQ